MLKNLKRYKKLIIFALLGITLTVGGCNVSKNIQAAKEKKEYTHSINIENKNVLAKETVISSIKDMNRIEILQMSLSKEVKIKQGKYFKKEQVIKFNLTGRYFLDLSKINSKNVLINNNKITIYTTKPDLEINFNEELTEFSDVEKGFFTVGDIKLTPQEMESIKSNLKNTITEEMQSEISTAKDNTSKALVKALYTITGESYNVEVYFVE